MKRSYRWPIYIEVLICFGALGLLLLVGLIAAPIWMGDIVSALTSTPSADPQERTVWDSIWPLAVVVSGLVGFWGLLRVLRVLRNPASTNARGGRRATLSMIVVGLLGLILFNFVAGPLPVATDPQAWPALLVYFILPVGCALHLLFLVRKHLFAPSSSQRRAES